MGLYSYCQQNITVVILHRTKGAMMFKVGDKVRIESPGAWFNGRKGIIIDKHGDSGMVPLFNVRFPDPVGFQRNLCLVGYTIGIGFKQWELREVGE
jgi:hypothetical protein